LHVMVVTIALLIDPIVMNAVENACMFQNAKFYSLSQFVALINSAAHARSKRWNLDWKPSGSQICTFQRVR
jgi:hypothetical protein